MAQGISMERLSPNGEVQDTVFAFTLNGDKYAVKNSSVYQIVQYLTISPVANCADYILGSTAFQGEILPIINLSSFLYDKPRNKSLSDKRHYIILKFNDKSVVFTVETVLGIIKKSDESILTEIIDLPDSQELLFFDAAFLKDNDIFVKLNIKSIFSQISRDQIRYFDQLQSESNKLNEPIKLPTSLEDYNVELPKRKIASQEVKRNLQPLTSITSPKFSGTMVTIEKISFIIPNERVVKIFDVTNITEVPNTTQSVVGVINFQGEVISVLDISKLVTDYPDYEKKSLSLNNVNKKALLLEMEEERVALLVDEVQEFFEIDERKIISCSNFLNTDKGGYLFQGAIINKFEQILLIFDVDYLHKHLIASEDYKKDDDKIIIFENRHLSTPQPKYASLEEGLLIEDSENLFLIDSKYVSQVLDSESYIKKKYKHSALKGAAIHWGIIPLIDFNHILNGVNLEDSKIGESMGILLNHPDTGFEVVFLIENVLGRKSSNEFEVYQSENLLSTKILSPIFSGFFSYQGNLGFILNPTVLLEESFTILNQNLGLDDPQQDFVSTLLPDEKEFLENIQARRKENQLLTLLEQREKGTRYDYFTLKLQKVKFAIDVKFVERVIGSVEIRNVNKSEYPIVGISKVDEEDIEVVDLASVLIKGYMKSQVTMDTNFFILSNQSHSFIIPVDSIEGVITVFEYELQTCDQSDSILQENNNCKLKIKNVEDTSLTYIIDNDFLETNMTQDGIKSLQIDFKK